MPRRQLGFMRRLPEKPFDQLAAILLDNRFRAMRAAVIPYEVVQPRLLRGQREGMATPAPAGKRLCRRAGGSQPAVPIKKSVTADYIICLDDGKKLKSLERHLSTHYGVTPDKYRAKWGLPVSAGGLSHGRAELRPRRARHGPRRWVSAASRKSRKSRRRRSRPARRSQARSGARSSHRHNLRTNIKRRGPTPAFPLQTALFHMEFATACSNLLPTAFRLTMFSPAPIERPSVHPGLALAGTQEKIQPALLRLPAQDLPVRRSCSTS